MVELYTYKVIREVPAFQIPPLTDEFWNNNQGQVCFKISLCPRLEYKDGLVYLQQVTHNTLKAQIGDYLMYQYNEFCFVKKKVFELKYKKHVNK
jgi:hypothetical protein